MDSLYDDADEPRRQKLRDLGWVDVTGHFGANYRCWRNPKTGAVLSEQGAFEELERTEGPKDESA